jgi:hypothetical protein
MARPKRNVLLAITGALVLALLALCIHLPKRMELIIRLGPGSNHLFRQGFNVSIHYVASRCIWFLTCTPGLDVMGTRGWYADNKYEYLSLRPEVIEDGKAIRVSLDRWKVLSIGRYVLADVPIGWGQRFREYSLDDDNFKLLSPGHYVANVPAEEALDAEGAPFFEIDGGALHRAKSESPEHKTTIEVNINFGTQPWPYLSLRSMKAESKKCPEYGFFCPIKLRKGDSERMNLRFLWYPTSKASPPIPSTVSARVVTTLGMGYLPGRNAPIGSFQFCSREELDSWMAQVPEDPAYKVNVDSKLSTLQVRAVGDEPTNTAKLIVFGNFTGKNRFGVLIVPIEQPDDDSSK